MKPLHLSVPEVPAVTLLNRKSAKPSSLTDRLATRMLSNVQLFARQQAEIPLVRTGGHIAVVR
jgi:hypothetical protein